MPKYIFDVQFDIPCNVLDTLPKESPLKGIKTGVTLERITLAKNDDEYTEVRLACEGTDSHCQKLARTLTLTIGNNKYKANGSEIVHCQG